MRTLFIYVILFITSQSLHIDLAQAQNRIKPTLNELDEVIASREVYHYQVEDQISAIKAKINNSSSVVEKHDLYLEVFNNYLHFQADSALHYVNVREKLAFDIGDEQLQNLVKINRAEVYGVMGMYNETIEELKCIEVQQLADSIKGYFYRTYRAYYGWIADYTAVESAKHKYQKMVEKYRDSVLMFEPLNANRNMIEVEKLINQNLLDRAIEELNILSELTTDKKQQAYIHYNLAQIYMQKEDVESAIYYLAKTAIVDLKMGTREYASLQHLAYVLYQEGDINRAYEYLSCSMEDAVASNARLRFMEVTKYYPIIDRTYRSKDTMQRNATKKMLLIVSLFTVVLVILSIYLYISRGRLAATRGDLRKTNESLITLNNRLAETGRIKEVYIARYLERCVTYIDKLDMYRRTLKRLASSSKIDELLKALQSEQMLLRERKEFYVEFDRSFLTLFPNFVSDFNMLLHDGEQMKLKSDSQLNTELRIFALIRLGITDAAQIAHFLGYSLATVYSYRSKMRNRSIVDNDLFEQRVMEL